MAGTSLRDRIKMRLGAKKLENCVKIGVNNNQETFPASRHKINAEELFAASVAADADQWLQFQLQSGVPAREQLQQLKTWLMTNKPSAITRSSGIGWIAVKFKDRKKKALEAKYEWVNEEYKKMELINQLAEKYQVKGGKWMCHLPSSLVDDVWSRLAIALMFGSLGPNVYMVKVSPVEDTDLDLSRGEHVICVYNTNSQNIKQVMMVENSLRSAGVETVLNYKPDIFSTLGIYRNNKWGFRPIIYSSSVVVKGEKSQVEVVGGGKWYHNSREGLEHLTSDNEASSNCSSLKMETNSKPFIFAPCAGSSSNSTYKQPQSSKFVPRKIGPKNQNRYRKKSVWVRQFRH